MPTPPQIPGENHRGEGGGRPTKFEPRMVKQAFKLALMGATNEDLATIWEVDVATIYRWLNEFPKFCEALRKGRDEADAEVIHSLYQHANGYSHPDVDIRVVDGEIVK